MSNNLGVTYQSAILNWIKGTAFPATLANTYMALFTTAPTNSGGGVEAAYSGYARVAIPSGNWSALSGHSPEVMTNANVVDFGVAGGAATIVAFAIMDAASVGNIIVTGSLASTAISNGQRVTWAVGTISVSATNISNYFQDAILNWIKGTTFPAAPANTYLALYTVAPTNAGGGTECSGSGYARAAIPSSGWSALTGSSPTTISNSSAITFAAISATIGNVVAMAILDALTVGNLLFWGTTPSTATAASTLALATGQFVPGID